MSYRRDDVPDATDRMARSLGEHFGTDHVFVDVDTIEPGERFADVIARWIDRSDVLLVMIGQRWLQDGRLQDPTDYVRLEVEAGLRRGIPVIPMLVHDASMPSPEGLPESQNDYREIDVPPGGQVKASFQVTGVPGPAKTLSVFFAHLFSQDPTLIPTLSNGLRITGCPSPAEYRTA